MQPQERIDVRQHFKEDHLNILVATSVAEEGLDIQACNMVIAKIQSRGKFSEGGNENSRLSMVIPLKLTLCMHVQLYNFVF